MSEKRLSVNRVISLAEVVEDSVDLLLPQLQGSVDVRAH